MIKILSKKTTIFVVILLLFLLGQVLGNRLMMHLFLDYQSEELEHEAKEIENAYVKGLPYETRRNIILKIYDIRNNEFIESNDIHEGELNLDPIVKKSLHQLLNKKTVSFIAKVDGLHEDSVIIGFPIVENSSVIGALFYLSPADEFQATVKGYTRVYSITIVAGTLIIVLYFSIYLKQSKELEQIRKDYIANVSHELKSPIASIKALTETLSDDLIQDADKQKKYYGIILKESNRLERLILDMLELSKIQSGKMDFSKKKISAESVFLPVFQKYSVLCDEMGLEFKVDCQLSNLPILETNPERIQQLVGLLLDNAVKFVDENGEISVCFTPTSRSLTVMIKDNGVGINKDVLPHIFERFYKVDKAHNLKGSGLGLAIAKEIAAGLDEKLGVESEVGKGTTFHFTIKHV